MVKTPPSPPSPASCTPSPSAWMCCCDRPPEKNWNVHRQFINILVCRIYYSLIAFLENKFLGRPMLLPGAPLFLFKVIFCCLSYWQHAMVYFTWFKQQNTHKKKSFDHYIKLSLNHYRALSKVLYIRSVGVSSFSIWPDIRFYAKERLNKVMK